MNKWKPFKSAGEVINKIGKQKNPEGSIHYALYQEALAEKGTAGVKSISSNIPEQNKSKSLLATLSEELPKKDFDAALTKYFELDDDDLLEDTNQAIPFMADFIEKHSQTLTEAQIRRIAEIDGGNSLMISDALGNAKNCPEDLKESLFSFDDDLEDEDTIDESACESAVNEAINELENENIYPEDYPTYRRYIKHLANFITRYYQGSWNESEIDYIIDTYRSKVVEIGKCSQEDWDDYYSGKMPG